MQIDNFNFEQEMSHQPIMAGPPGSPAFITEKENKKQKNMYRNKDNTYNKARKRETKKTYFHK